ncbi:Protein ACS-16 [Aphelenchoides avenae]|nr:Protein ACS-16 [Aphelenchus avenae]
MAKDGNIEIIAHKSDLMYDRKDALVEHWRMEKAMSMYDQIKGVQVVQVCHGAPIVAVLVPKSYPKYAPEFLKTDLSAMCRSKNVYVPDQFAIIDDFPRINTKVQKYKLREMLKQKKLPIF